MIQKTIWLGLGAFTLSGCMMLGSFQKVTPPTALPTLTPASPATTSTPPTASGQTALGGKQSGELLVWIYGNPNPPIRGVNTLEIFVADTKGAPINNAKVSFDLDMTNMSHGKNIITATSLGNGRYSGDVRFLMPGPWRVIVGVEQNGKTENVRFEFNVNWR